MPQTGSFCVAATVNPAGRLGPGPAPDRVCWCSLISSSPIVSIARRATYWFLTPRAARAPVPP